MAFFDSHFWDTKDDSEGSTPLNQYLKSLSTSAPSYTGDIVADPLGKFTEGSYADKQLTNYENNEQGNDALGIKDKAIKGATGFLTGASKVLDFARAVTFSAAREQVAATAASAHKVAELITGKDIDPKKTANTFDDSGPSWDRFYKNVKSGYKFSDAEKETGVSALIAKDTDSRAKRWGLGAVNFVGDTVFDPLTYASFGAAAVGKKALAELIEHGAPQLAKLGAEQTAAVGGEAAAAKVTESLASRHAASKVGQDLANGKHFGLEPDHALTALDDDIARTTRDAGTVTETVDGKLVNRKLTPEELASQQLGKELGAAMLRNGSTGVRAVLYQHYGEDVGRNLFNSLAGDIRGNLRLRVPFSKDAAGINATIGIGEGGGRLGSKIGITKLEQDAAGNYTGKVGGAFGKLAERRLALRNTPYVGKVLGVVPKRFSGALGPAYNDTLKTLYDEKGGISSKGYETFSAIRDSKRAGDKVAAHYEDAFQRILEDGVTAGLASKDRATFDESFSYYFSNPTATKRDLDKVTGDQLLAAKQADKMHQLTADLGETLIHKYGGNVTLANYDAHRLATDEYLQYKRSESVLGRNAPKGSNSNSPLSHRSAVFAELVKDPETGRNVVGRYKAAKEANDEFRAKTGKDIDVYSTNPLEVFNAYGRGIIRQLSQKEMIDRLVQSGTTVATESGILHRADLLKLLARQKKNSTTLRTLLASSAARQQAAGNEQLGSLRDALTSARAKLAEPQPTKLVRPFEDQSRGITDASRQLRANSQQLSTASEEQLAAAKLLRQQAHQERLGDTSARGLKADVQPAQAEAALAASDEADAAFKGAQRYLKAARTSGKPERLAAAKERLAGARAAAVAAHAASDYLAGQPSLDQLSEQASRWLIGATKDEQELFLNRLAGAGVDLRSLDLHENRALAGVPEHLAAGKAAPLDAEDVQDLMEHAYTGSLHTTSDLKKTETLARQLDDAIRASVPDSERQAELLAERSHLEEWLGYLRRKHGSPKIGDELTELQGWDELGLLSEADAGKLQALMAASGRQFEKQGNRWYEVTPGRRLLATVDRLPRKIGEKEEELIGTAETLAHAIKLMDENDHAVSYYMEQASQLPLEDAAEWYRDLIVNLGRMHDTQSEALAAARRTKLTKGERTSLVDSVKTLEKDRKKRALFAGDKQIEGYGGPTLVGTKVAKSDFDKSLEEKGLLQLGEKVGERELNDAAIGAWANLRGPEQTRLAVQQYMKVPTMLPEELDKLINNWYKPYLALFRIHATSGPLRGAGYHVRNLSSGFWNNWIGGVNSVDNWQSKTLSHERHKALADAKKLMPENTSVKNIEAKAHELLQKAEALQAWVAGPGSFKLIDVHNAIEGQGLFNSSRLHEIFGEVGRANTTIDAKSVLDGVNPNPLFPHIRLEDLTRGQRAANKLATMKAVRGADRGGSWWLLPIGSNAAELSEEYLRTAAFISASRRWGLGDGTNGRILADALHFKYDDLSGTERAVKQWLMPFYTFTRYNVPLQVRALLHEPGKIERLLRANEAAKDLFASDDPNDQDWLPANVRNKLGWATGIKTSGGKIAVGVDLPVTDLENYLAWSANPLDSLGRAKNQLQQGINPLLKTGIEQVQGVDSYTQQPFQDTDAPNWTRLLGLTHKNADGDVVTNQRLVNLVRNTLPVASPVERLIPFGQQQSSKDRLGTSYAAFTGVPGFGVLGPTTLTESQVGGELARRNDASYDAQDEVLGKYGIDSEWFRTVKADGWTSGDIRSALSRGYGFKSDMAPEDILANLRTMGLRNE